MLRRWMFKLKNRVRSMLHGRRRADYITCAVIIGLPLTCIYIGYTVGTYFLPPFPKFPSPGVVADVSRLNYSLYNTHNLSIEFVGGIGNQMFQYASLYGIAKANGLKPIVPADFALARMFSRLKAQRAVGPVERDIGHYWERRAHAFDSRVFSLNFMRNIALQGFYQSWRYFDHARSDVRRQFAFHAAVERDVDAFLYDALRDHRRHISSNTDTAVDSAGVKFVGVHVRRGDYLEDYNIKKGYTVADAAYFIKALRYFEKKYAPNIVFVVCSDDQQWSQANVQSEHSVVVHSPFGDRPDHDLCLLSRCNHTIITVGTFGWWGAWLAGGQTVYYRDYPRQYSELADGFRMNDYYIPQWIAM